jgi:hypothetical protein
MKKFLRIIIAIIILPLWLLWCCIMCADYLCGNANDWIQDKSTKWDKNDFQDVWLSLYRWVRL